MKAHRTDGVSLVFALIFLAVAGWWLLAQLLDLALPAVGWFVAGALIVIGALGLLGALRSGRSAPPTAGAPTAGAPIPGAPPPGPVDADPPATAFVEQGYGTGDAAPTQDLRQVADGTDPGTPKDEDDRPGGS